MQEYNHPHGEKQEPRVLGRPVSIITDDAEKHSALCTCYSNVNEEKSYMSDLHEVFHIRCISYHYLTTNNLQL